MRAFARPSPETVLQQRCSSVFSFKRVVGTPPGTTHCAVFAFVVPNRPSDSHSSFSGTLCVHTIRLRHFQSLMLQTEFRSLRLESLRVIFIRYISTDALCCTQNSQLRTSYLKFVPWITLDVDGRPLAA